MDCFHQHWTYQGSRAICSDCGKDISYIPGKGWEKWFWKGSLKEVLAAIKGHEYECTIEKGILVKENDRDHDMRRLIEGDVVYRLWGGQEKIHEFENNFRWFLLDIEGNVVKEAWGGQTKEKHNPSSDHSGST